MNPRVAWAVIEEAYRRLVPAPVQVVAKRVWRFIGTLHAKQLELHHAKGHRKAALCSRRAGKSFYAAAALLEAAGDHPDSLCAYIALTRDQARRIMWRELKRFDRLYHLGLDFSETRLTATLRNGSEIHLIGAMNPDDVERIRGVPFVLIVIDEAGTFPCKPGAEGDDDDKYNPNDVLEKMWREVLQPTMLDYQGTVLLIGTPTAACRGFFYKVTRDDDLKRRRKGWEVFSWTVLDNPHVPKVKTEEIPDAKTWLQKEVIEAEGVSPNDPAFQREWLGRWIRSLEALVYRSFSRAKNVYTKIAGDNRIEWSYGVSVDLGYDDPTVIGLFKWCQEIPTVYLARCIKRAGMIPAQIAAEIKRLQREVGTGLAFVVVDQGGGAGKMIAEEFRALYALPNVKGAEKTKKATYIELVNGDFATGRFKIHDSCTPVLEEIGVLQWDARAPGVKEDERFANDACDMMLYGFREARHHTSFDEDAPVVELEPEEIEKEELEMERTIERAHRASDPYDPFPDR